MRVLLARIRFGRPKRLLRATRRFKVQSISLIDINMSFTIRSCNYPIISIVVIVEILLVVLIFVQLIVLLVVISTHRI